MAEVIGAIGAVVGLVEATESLLRNIRRFFRAIEEVPEVIITVKAQISLWQTHLEVLCDLSRGSSPIDEMGDFLEQKEVLKDARFCLERLSAIVADSTPPDQRQGRVSSVWDRVTFHMKHEREVETLLKRMDNNTQHLDLALSMSTKLVPRSFHSPLGLSLIFP